MPEQAKNQTSGVGLIHDSMYVYSLRKRQSTIYAQTYKLMIISIFISN